ncbi:response regulator transcription factor [Roseiarcus fermentans]|uniref:response regulator transcription factor n=1 Tax=Roseiarcus fermentans TaxID=1473586 RepID=UPI0014733B86|nr:response regulator transcription factor [Roseiarcus fermentans]
MFRDLDGPDAPGIIRAWPSDRILVVYDKLFLAECLKSVLQTSLNAPVQICSSLDEICDEGREGDARLILFLIDTVKTPDTYDLLRQATAVAKAPVVVLSHSREQRVVREVMQCGAKAYIPMMTGISVAIEAVRFVLAGGTYVPPESLMETGREPVAGLALETVNPVTLRELSIIQAIQQGKSNKIIAYELKLCESTVKVHIRNIMRKLNAKNRTAVAVRSAELLVAPELGKIA